MPFVHSVILGLLLCACLVPRGDAEIGKNGLCNLNIFAPLTFGGSDAYIGGIAHVAAALMAMDHFNERNSAIVPELEDIQDCPIMFDIDNTAVFDTETFTHAAVEKLFAQEELPCAVVGPYHDIPALELSGLATAAAKFPVTVYRAFNLRITAEYSAPFTSQVFPGMADGADILVEALKIFGRTNYTAILYALSDTGIQRREALSAALDAAEMQNRAYGYHIELVDNIRSEKRDAMVALRGVKASGFRTIVVAPEFPFFEIYDLADAAEEVGLNNGEYLWLWFGDFADELWNANNTNTNITKLASGSLLLAPFDPFLAGGDDPFLNEWLAQDASKAARLRDISPIAPGEPGYFEISDDAYATNFPAYGSTFVYDAVMATGIGACLAAATDGESASVYSHVAGIREADFRGASGYMRFSNEPGMSGLRNASTVTWGIFNNLPPQPEGEAPVPFTVPLIFQEGEWSYLGDLQFVFADGTSDPPALLRDLSEQNYLSDVLRIFGFVLLGIGYATAIGIAVWIFVNRRHPLLKASQPIFLYLLCCGAIVSVSTIVTISFDESQGWSEESLSRACMATPCIIALGHIITYSALFCKLWRINRVLQFNRRKVDPAQVVWPSVILMAMALVVIQVWRTVDPLRWQRTIVNAETLESIGQCQSEHLASFVVPLVILMLIPTLLTAYMAWKTRDIDDKYSESYWIMMTILVQVEVILVSIPLIFVLRDGSTDGRYLGLTTMIWCFPMSTLLLIFVPKIVRHRRLLRGEGEQAKRGGPSGNVKVSGIPAGARSPGASSTSRRQSTPTPSGSESLGAARPGESSEPSHVEIPEALSNTASSNVERPPTLALEEDLANATGTKSQDTDTMVPEPGSAVNDVRENEIESPV